MRAQEKGTQTTLSTTKKEAEEGRRRVKFAKRVQPGDQEEDFEEQTLTLNEVEAKSILLRTSS